MSIQQLLDCCLLAKRQAMDLLHKIVFPSSYIPICADHQRITQSRDNGQRSRLTLPALPFTVRVQGAKHSLSYIMLTVPQIATRIAQS